jgi:hypothetical protein
VIARAISSPVGSTRSVHSAATATEASATVGGSERRLRNCETGG